jgi:putative iron-regulated protein
MQRRLAFSAIAALALNSAAPGSIAWADAPSPSAVIATYEDMAAAMYGDALAAAKPLQQAVDALIAAPTEANLVAARNAWKAARIPYMQTEGYRFGNSIVDDWEGDINSWPLDEGLIDYVDKATYGGERADNPLYTANVIANPKLRIGPDVVDASVITPELLKTKLQQALGVEANVATGYHAIEFLLWGQDLHGTGPGAGERPASDYDQANCTHGNCDRRAAYLKAATDLLVTQLGEMTDDWGKDGKARKALDAKDEKGQLSTILTGLATLSYGELAGDRMKLGLLLHDPEEEHDCFSDNTHNSYFYDQVGMMELWNAKYTRLDGSVVQGASMRDFALAKAPAEAAEVDKAMAATQARLKAIKDTADSGRMAYDQMLAAGNAEGAKLVGDAVDALVAQTRTIERLDSRLGLSIEIGESDALDHPESAKR